MLTMTEIRSARPRENAYKLFDGGGLYIEITPTGGKLWGREEALENLIGTIARSLEAD